LESNCCNTPIDNDSDICESCGKICQPIETEEEVRERLQGQDSDYEYIKNNIGLTDH